LRPGARISIGRSPAMRPAFITITRSASARISSSSLTTPPAPRRRRRAVRAQAGVDEFDGADVHAARGLADQQHGGLAAQGLARQHQLLLVAAAELALRSCGLRGRTS
jgi:hypothetical protein